MIAVNASAAPVRLIDAVKSADRAAIQTLLQQRVDVNAAEPDGTTALHWAVYLDKVEAATKPLQPTLLTSNLSSDQEKQLREIFAEDPA